MADWWFQEKGGGNRDGPRRPGQPCSLEERVQELITKVEYRSEQVRGMVPRGQEEQGAGHGQATEFSVGELWGMVECLGGQEETWDMVLCLSQNEMGP